MSLEKSFILRNFVKKGFGVKFEDEIDVWATYSKNAWESGDFHEITTVFSYKNPIFMKNLDKEKQVQRMTLMDCKIQAKSLVPPEKKGEPQYNTKHTAILGVLGIAARSSYPVHTSFRLNYTHKQFQKTMEVKNRQQEAGGGVRGACLVVGPSATETIDLPNTPFIGCMNYGVLHPGFVKTMTNINPGTNIVDEHGQLLSLDKLFENNNGNLLNGIFKIPREICIKSGLVVYKPEEGDVTKIENSEGKKLMHWYAVPTDHVLAWMCRTPPRFRKANGMNVLEYRVTPRRSLGREPFVLFFLVGDNTFRELYCGYLNNFSGRSDLTDLTKIGIEMVPSLNMEHKVDDTVKMVKGEANVRVKFRYCVFRDLNMGQLRSLRPTLAKEMPPYNQYIVMESEQEQNEYLDNSALNK